MPGIRKGTKKWEIIEQTKNIIAQYTTKLTVRQIYYRLVSKHVIPNIQSQYQYLVKTLVSARWQNLIKFSDIEDRTRQFLGRDEPLKTPGETFQSWYNAFKTCDEYHDLPRWLDQPKYIEVWLEKQALQGLFYEITNPQKVTLFPCRGYPSLTKLYESASRIHFGSEGRAIMILYFGDYDPSGEDINRKIEEDLLRFGLSFSIEKIAITKEQIEEYEIPPMPAKESDPRYADFVATHGDVAVELDAIDPDALQKIVKEAIEKHFDEEIYEEVQVRQEQEREEIQEMVEKVLK